MTEEAALGFSVHTGWAALVVVAGPLRHPAVLDRRQVEMIAGKERAPPRFVFHAARELRGEERERSVATAKERSRARATAALQTMVSALRSGGRHVAIAAIVGSTAPPPEAPLERILESHAAIHSAEGELFRAAVAAACDSLRIPVVRVPARDLSGRAAELLGLSPDGLAEWLAKVGQAAGRPWAKDQKDGFLAALLARSLASG